MLIEEYKINLDTAAYKKMNAKEIIPSEKEKLTGTVAKNYG